MSTSIGQNGLENQLDYMVREFVKEKLETIMKEEMNSFFELEHQELKNRKMGTIHGSWIQNTAAWTMWRSQETGITPFRRKCFPLISDANKTIIAMYQKGMSTREIGHFLEWILGHGYSTSTISQIIEVVMEDVEACQNRQLQKTLFRVVSRRYLLEAAARRRRQ